MFFFIEALLLLLLLRLLLLLSKETITYVKEFQLISTFTNTVSPDGSAIQYIDPK